MLSKAGTPLAIERISLSDPTPFDVVVSVRAAGALPTHLEVINGALRYPLPMILGQETAGWAHPIAHRRRGP